MDFIAQSPFEKIGFEYQLEIKASFYNQITKEKVSL